MDDTTREFVRARAENRCEFCRLRQTDFSVVRFQVEHVVAKKHLGGDEPDNLGLACPHCNLHKGANLSGIDPHTDAMTRLFHPRRDVWHEHFRQIRGEIVGISDVGRTTVQVLKINSEQQVQLREATLEV